MTANQIHFSGQTFDITGADGVEVQFDERENGRIVRVNVDGILYLRVCRIANWPGITVTDDRPQKNLDYALRCVEEIKLRLERLTREIGTLRDQRMDPGPLPAIHDDIADQLTDIECAIRDFRGEER